MNKLNNIFLSIKNIIIKELCLFIHTTPIIIFLENHFLLKGLIYGN